MENLLAGIDFKSGIILNELMAWMDGGSVSLMLTDENKIAFTMVFCQKMSLEIHPGTGTWIPGSFLLNDVEIPIRSANERVILDALKVIRFSDKIPKRDRPLERKTK